MWETLPEQVVLMDFFSASRGERIAYRLEIRQCRYLRHQVKTKYGGEIDETLR